MEQINAIVFYINALLIIFSGFAVIFAKRVMNSVFFALICFFCFGFLFLSLNAPFNGAVQMALYGAALTIIFAIAVSVTDYKNELKNKIKLSPRFFISAAGVIMISFSIVFFINEAMKYEPSLMMYMRSSSLLTSADSIKQLSYELLTRHYYSFELLGLYLLIAAVGTAVLWAFKGEIK